MTESEEKSDESQPLAKEKVTETFLSDDGIVSIEVDAEVKDYDGAMPMVRIQPHEITPDDVKHWAKVFFGTEEVYEPKNVLTKSEIEKEILWRQERISSGDLLAEYGEEGIDMMTDLYQQDIENYQKAYEDAPETYEQKKTDWTFHPSSYYSKSSIFNDGSEAYASYDQSLELNIEGEIDGMDATIGAVNRTADDFNMHRISFYYLDEEKLNAMEHGTKLSEEQAIALADEKVSQLLGNAWTRLSASYEKYSNIWRMRYVPLIEGIPAIDVGEMAIDLKSEDAYAANLNYSGLDVHITGEQIDYIALTSPMDAVEVENDNVALLSFEDIYERFKSQTKMIYNADYFLNTYKKNLAEYDYEQLKEELEQNDVPGDVLQVHVTSVEKGMFRVKVKNSENEFQWIPVWVFWGNTKDPFGVFGEDSRILQVINAVDGSNINVGLGY